MMPLWIYKLMTVTALGWGFAEMLSNGSHFCLGQRDAILFTSASLLLSNLLESLLIWIKAGNMP